MAKTSLEQNNSVALRDIAQKLNVAVSTVSRALNGDDGVGKTRAASIRATAQQMGYRPRPIRRKRTRAIGLVLSTSAFHNDLPDPDELYFQQLSWWMERLIARHDLHLHLKFVDREDVNPQLPMIIQENRVDGIIMGGHPSAALCRLMQDSSTPAVVISDTVERTGLDCIMIDETQTIKKLVNQLASMGHRHLAWISTQRRYPVIAAAENAFLEAAQQAGLHVPEHHRLHDFGPDLASGRRATDILLASTPAPTAIIYATDWLALGGLGQIQRLGMKVPQEISIIGRGNDRIGEEAEPRLTTIDRRIGDILAKALQVLLDCIESEVQSPQQHWLQARMVWRDSCAPPPSRRSSEEATTQSQTTSE